MSLELPPDRMRELGYKVVDMIVDRYAQLPEARVWTGATRRMLDDCLRESAPEAPGDPETALRRIFDEVLPFGASVDHPRFMAFVPGAPTWPGILGDFIAAGADVFQGTWLASSGASALELVVLDWFRTWLDYDESAAGLLVAGGSAANLTALACARITRFDSHEDRATVYCSAETHSSVARAARVLGFADGRVRELSADSRQQLDPASLAEAMDADRDAGLIPFFVVANGGTTSTGAVDPLPAVADVCEARGAWLHVDAAYGGFAAITERGRAELTGIGRADSIALDPHKWLYQPFEAGCLLVRDGALLDNAFRVMPPYLQDTVLQESVEGAPGEDVAAPPGEPRLPVNFADRGIQLTRSARAFKIWLSVQTFGLAAFRDAIAHCIELADMAELHIASSDNLELTSPARLGIVCFRLRGDSDDSLNRAAMHALRASGTAMVSSTRVAGAFTLRLCVLNYRTKRGDVIDVLDWFDRFAAAARPDLSG